MDAAAVGTRVTRWGSHHVGTVETAFDTACVVRWDQLRLPSRYVARVEETTYEFWSYLYPASDYAEFWNRVALNAFKSYPKPQCWYCSIKDDLRFVERQHESHDGTPYVYVWQCCQCKRLIRVNEDDKSQVRW